ncbi:MAG: FAD-dependent oxidoreductase [Polyangiaceae bacterium]
MVGAGVAGLAAAHELSQAGKRVVVLEARDRIGGRLCTSRVWPDMPLDLGASWIHGSKGNPIRDLARELGVETRATNWERIRLYRADGKLAGDDERERLAKRLEDLVGAVGRDPGDAADLKSALEAASRELNMTARERDDLAFAYVSEIEQDLAADLAELSPQAADEGRAEPGDDLVMPGGYDQILRGLTPGVDVRLSHIVEKIRHGSDGVHVETNRGVLSAAYAIVTLPIGVLKAGRVTFEPGLGEAKKTAITRLGSGLLNKLYLQFDRPFWPEDAELFGRLNQKNGEFASLMNMGAYMGKPVLMWFHAGSAARRFERLTDAQAVAASQASLKDMFGAGVREPIGCQVTRWASDPFSLGSYSFLARGATPEDRVALAAPEGERLLFAGEATESDYSATIHGAFLSGQREARRVLEG